MVFQREYIYPRIGFGPGSVFGASGSPITLTERGDVKDIKYKLNTNKILVLGLFILKTTFKTVENKKM